MPGLLAVNVNLFFLPFSNIAGIVETNNHDGTHTAHIFLHINQPELFFVLLSGKLLGTISSFSLNVVFKITEPSKIPLYGRRIYHRLFD